MFTQRGLINFLKCLVITNDILVPVRIICLVIFDCTDLATLCIMLNCLARETGMKMKLECKHCIECSLCVCELQINIGAGFVEISKSTKPLLCRINALKIVLLSTQVLFLFRI